MESFLINDDGFMVSYDKPSDTLYIKSNGKTSASVISSSDMVSDSLIVNLGPAKTPIGLQVLGVKSASAHFNLFHNTGHKIDRDLLFTTIDYIKKIKNG